MIYETAPSSGRSVQSLGSWAMTIKIIQLDTGKVLWEGKTLSGADLTRADLYGANLTRADLSGANLSGANLSGADLYEANLTRADLTRANLTRANLSGADLIVGGHRSDGYRFVLIKEPSGAIMVSAGCRYFSVEIARQHWKDTRGGTQLGDESQALVDHLVAMAKIAGWAVPQ